MKQKKTSPKKFQFPRYTLKTFPWIKLLWLTAAGIVNAIGVTIFIAPVNLYDSGISGTSILLDQITPEQWTLSIFLVLLNVPLFLYGLKKQGLRFTLSAIYTVCIYSLFAWLITDILPIDVSVMSPLAGEDLLLCALFGGLVSGIGSGLAIRSGGAMDGVEVMAVIFAKKLGITVGTFVMIYNVILYCICGIIMKDWTLPLYSIVTYAVGIKTVDFIVEGLDRQKGVNIITAKPDEICKALSDALEHGMTLWDAKGYYSDREKTMVYVVVNRFQVAKMKEIVREIDPSAYITICEIADVYAAKK